MHRLSLAFLASAAFLAACATSSDVVTPEVETPTPVLTNQLGAQTLAIGECGLFGWTTEKPSRFVFFATETRGSYWTGTSATPLNPSGTFPELQYSDFEIELGAGEDYAEAIRYPSARLRRTMSDGFERVQPLVILETCQELDRP